MGKIADETLPTGSIAGDTYLIRHLRTIFATIRNNFRTAGVQIDMGDERFRALLAAPLASLILILLVCVFAISRPASVGISMPILRLRTSGQHATCDGRWVFVVLKDDGNVEVNLVPVSDQKLSAMVGKLMESRAERIVYLVPSADVSYSKFVQTLDTLRSSAVDVHVGVLSGSIRDEYLGSKPKLKRTYLPCDIIWPAKEFQAAK